VPKSADVDPDEKTMHGVLDKLRGAEFDTAYMAGQVAAHQKTAHLLEYVIGSGQDEEDLRRLAHGRGQSCSAPRCVMSASPRM
jgi:predicted outer membrane protein